MHRIHLVLKIALLMAMDTTAKFCSLYTGTNKISFETKRNCDVYLRQGSISWNVWGLPLKFSVFLCFTAVSGSHSGWYVPARSLVALNKPGAGQ